MLSGKKRDPVNVNLKRPTAPGRAHSFAVDKTNLTIHPGDELEFRFVNCKNPTIMIPVEGVMEKRIATPDENEPGIIRMKVLSNPTRSAKPFAYAVYSPEIDDFAVGNSPPRMVLVPDPKR